MTDYPNQKVITLAKWETMKEDNLEEEKEEGVDIEGEETQELIKEADEGEMLVLRRTLSRQRSEKEDQ